MKGPFSSELNVFKDSLVILENIAQGAIKAKDKTVLTPYKLLEYIKGLGSEGIPEDKIESVKEILSEEVCEMALPVALDGGKNYVKLAELRNDAGFSEDISLLQAKLSLLRESKLIDLFFKNIPRGYGFVTYPAYMLVQSKDLMSRFPANPEKYFEYAYPLIYELEGLCDVNGSPMPGWLAFYFIKPTNMRGNVPLVRKKIVEAVQAIEKLNGKLVGLGGLSASLTDGGAYLMDKTSVKITTGHGYTIMNIINIMKRAAKSVELQLKDAVVEVVGAAGSVGSGVAQLSAMLGVKEIILVDYRSVDEIIKKINQISKVPVSIGNLKMDTKKADIVLVATSSSNVIFKSDDFKPGAIILDDSQPKNIAKSFLKREDIVTLEAGTVQLPKKFSYTIHRAFGPKLKKFAWSHVNLPMAGENEVPSCLAEVMIWGALNKDRETYSVGKSDPELASYLDKESSAIGFSPAPLQSFGKNIEEGRLRDVREIHHCLSKT